MLIDNTNLIRNVRFKADSGAAGGGEPDNTGEGNAPEFPKWMAQLGDEDKENKDFAQYQSIPEFAGAFKELKVKADGIETAPESVDEYELEMPEAPEGFEEDADTQKAFREFAKASNFTKAQAKEAYKWFNQTIFDQYKAALAADAKRKDEALGQLKKDWGDEFEAKSELAQRALDAFGSEELQKAFTASGFIAHPEVIKAFAKIGEAIGEDQLEPGSAKDGATGDEKLLNEIYPSMKDAPVRNRW